MSRAGEDGALPQFAHLRQQRVASSLAGLLGKLSGDLPDARADGSHDDQPDQEGDDRKRTAGAEADAESVIPCTTVESRRQDPQQPEPRKHRDDRHDRRTFMYPRSNNRIITLPPSGPSERRLGSRNVTKKNIVPAQ